MSYNTLTRMNNSIGLRDRLVACAAQEGESFPDQWVNTHKWRLVTEPGWAEAFRYAEDTRTINHNPDTGQREDVITDGMILAAVQAVRSEQAPPPTPPPAPAG